MSTRTRIVAVLTSLLFSSQLISAPSVMAEGQVVDVCANKSTGKVREIQSGNCKYTEWSIGAKAITPGKTYPSGMRSKMANRWFAVRVAASRAGYSLIMTSGFRRLVDQKYLYGKAIEKYGSRKKQPNLFCLLSIRCIRGDLQSISIATKVQSQALNGLN